MTIYLLVLTKHRVMLDNLGAEGLCSLLLRFYPVVCLRHRAFNLILPDGDGVLP